MARSKKPTHVAFFGISKAIKGNDTTYSFALSDDVKELHEMRPGSPEKEAKPIELPSVDEQADPDRHPMAQIMSNFRMSMLSYIELVGIQRVLLPTFKQSYIKNQLEDRAKRDFTLIEGDDNYAIYGISGKDIDDFLIRLERMQHVDAGLDVLPGATLLSIVATFDSYITDVVRLIIEKSGDRIKNSAKPVSLKDVFSSSSIEELKRRIVDDEIEGLMRGSHEDQVSYIEDQFSVKIREHYERWGNYVEIFERRNLVAHGNLTVNRIYMSKCSAAGRDLSKIKLGDELSIGPKYLSNVVSVLLEFGTLLMLVLWRKQFDTPATEIFKTVNAECVSMLARGRSLTAARILEFTLNKQKLQVPESMRIEMMLNLGACYKKSNKADQLAKILEGRDWSALADKYKIAVAALKEDSAEVVRLLPIVSKGGALTKQEFRSWPPLNQLHKNVSVRQAFLEVYGEQLNSVEEVEVSAASSSGAEQEETIH